MTTAPQALPGFPIPLTRLVRDAPPRQVLAQNGLTFKAQCITDPDDSTATQLLVTLASNEAGTEYSSTSVYFGNMQTIGPTDGDVQVICYSTTMAGTGFFGGIAATVVKPSGLVQNGTLAIGVGVLGADGVVAGTIG